MYGGDYLKKESRVIEISTGSIYLHAGSAKEAIAKVDALMKLGVTQMQVTFRVRDAKSDC